MVGWTESGSKTESEKESENESKSEIICAVLMAPVTFSLGTWPSYLTDLLSLRLVGALGARIKVRSSDPLWGPFNLIGRRCN